MGRNTSRQVMEETSNGLSRQDSIPMCIVQRLSLIESYL